MKKTKQLLFATLSILFSHAYGQSNVGKVLYSQLSPIVDRATGYSSWKGDPAPLGTGEVIIADDFDVPAGGWTIYGASYIVNRIPQYFTSYEIKIYSNNNGVPSLTPLPGGTITIDSINVDKLEFASYTTQCSFKFPSTLTLPQGKYWLSITGVARPYGTGQWLTNSGTTPTGATPKQLSFNAINNVWQWIDAPNGSNNNGMYKNLSFALLAVPDVKDLAARQILAPLSGELTATEQIKVAIQNKGTAIQTSYQVKYEIFKIIGGVSSLFFTSPTETVSGPITPNQIKNYTFIQRADLSSLNTYSIKVTVTLAGEVYTDNNFVSSTAINLGDVYLMGRDRTATTCGATFMDDGGYDKPYTAASMDTITFYPGDPLKRIALDFNFIDVFDNHFESWTFYDGTSTNAPILFKKERLAPFWTGPIKARNQQGAITLVTKANGQLLLGGQKGWIANVTCFTPAPIDFVALNLTVGSPTTYNVTGQAVNVSFVCTNAGTSNISRNVSFFQNGVLIAGSTTPTGILQPGEQKTLTYTWTPTVASKNVNFKAVIEADVNNGDNSLEKIVDVNRSGILLESFEGTTLPTYWNTQTGSYTIATNNDARHGNKIIQLINVGDTLRTPLTTPQVIDTLTFWANLPSAACSLKVIVKPASGGSWTTIGTAIYNSSGMTKYTIILPASITNGSSYYFAFVGQGSGNNIGLDDVRGVKLGIQPPTNIDFVALSLTVGSPTTYNIVNQPVNVSFVCANAGTTATSRTISLLQNGVVVGSPITTNVLAPGQQQILNFTWTPLIAANNINFKVAIQADVNPFDNSLTKIVDVNRSGILLESFEQATLPSNWFAQPGTYTIRTNVVGLAKHGFNVIRINNAGDTLRTPLTTPQAIDVLSFWTYLGSSAQSLKVIAKNASTGVWTTVGTATYSSANMNKYTFSLPASITNGGSYYFAFVAQGGGNISLDDVRGVTLPTGASLTLQLTALLEGKFDGSTMIGDAITVELRSNTGAFVSTAIGNLNTTGHATLTFNGVTNGNYYIVVKNRNSIQTWSKNTVVFSGNTIYDFTSGAAQAYGNNLKQKAGKWCIYSGDTNQDETVDNLDIGDVYNDAINYVTGDADTDLNGDLNVDNLDITITYNNSVNYVQVVKPF